MNKPILVELMDDYYNILNATPVEDIPVKLMRRAGIAPSHSVALEAMSRLLMLEYTRRRHAEAKCFEAEKMVEDMREKAKAGTGAGR